MIVEFDKSFSKSIDNINSKILKNRLLQMIELFEKAESIEQIPNVKKIVGNQFYYRYRIGDYRIGFSYKDNTIKFIIVAYRKEIYRIFP